MNKVYVRMIILVAILLGIVSLPSQADVAIKQENVAQTFKVSPKPNLMKKIAQFNRMQGVKIVTVNPHLNKENQKIILSDDQLISILKQAGFSGYNLKLAWAIAIKESTARPYAFNKSSNCYGLFQINMTGSMGPDRREKFNLKTNNDLFDPLINAKIAYHMSNGGKNWSAWTTNKSALKILDQYPG